MLKIGICQMAVEADKTKNINTARSMIAKAAAASCQLVVLPEMFNCPYQNDLFEKFAESYSSGETVNMLASAASDEGIMVVGGSIPEFDEGKVYNTSFIFNEQGNLIGRHRKVHLFDVDIKGGTVFKESETLSAGNEITMVSWNGITFGVAICYDIRFPEFARIMCDKGADILIYPAAFGPVTGPAHWELLIRSRAIDNQAFVIGAAPALTPGAQYQAYGHSMVVDPWGSILSRADEQETLLIADINLAMLDKIRAELPLLQHRRNEIYNKYRK